MGKQTKTPDKKQRIVRKLNRRQSLAAKFKSQEGEMSLIAAFENSCTSIQRLSGLQGFSNRRMKRRYQF